jgi:hypothetical protein
MRILRWMLLLSLLGLALLVIFHRPLILWGLKHATIVAGRSQQIQVDLQTQGSLWTDLSITSAKASTGPSGWLEKAAWGNLTVEYDWRALSKKDFQAGVKAIRLSDAELIADLRQLPKSSPPPADQTKTAQEPPPLIWPKDISLRGINLDLTLANGARLVAEDLVLEVLDQRAGELSWQRLEFHPAESTSQPWVLAASKAVVLRSGQTLTISDLMLPFALHVEELRVDLEKFSQDAIGLELALSRSNAQLRTKTQMQGLFRPPLKLESALSVRELTPASLEGLPLPKNIDFKSVNMELTASGTPLQPSVMSLKAELTAEGIDIKGVAHVDDVKLPLSLQNGSLTIAQAQATTGKNKIDLNASASVPSDIKQWQQTTWTAELNATLPQLAQILVKPLPLSATYTARIQTSGTGSQLGKVTTQLKAQDLVHPRFQLPQAEVNAVLNGRELQIKLPETALGTGNTASLNATLNLDENLPLKADWNVKVNSVQDFIATTHIASPPQPVSALIESTGRWQGSLTEAIKGDLKSMQGVVELKVRDLKVAKPGAGIENADLNVELQGPKLVIHQLGLQLDPSNHLSAVGNASLTDTKAFHLKAEVKLPHLEKLAPALQPFVANLPTKGAAHSNIQVQGTLQPWTCQGSVKVDASDVQLPSLPDALSLHLDATFEGQRANLAALESKLGPWRVSGSGVVTTKAVETLQFVATHSDKPLAKGTVRFPFDWLQSAATEPHNGPMQAAVEVHKLALSDLLARVGIEGVPQGLLDLSLNLQGRPEDLAGAVDVQFNGSDGLVEGLEPPKLKTALKLHAGKLLLSSEITQPPLKNITLNGETTVELKQLISSPEKAMQLPVKARLDLPSSDLDFVKKFAPDLIKAIPVTLSAQMELTGTPAQPQLKAALDATCSEVSFVNADLPSVRDVLLKVRANGHEVYLEDISLLLAGGRVKLTGKTDLQTLSKPLLDLRLDAQEALVFRDPSTSLRANAALRFNGTPDKVAVTGDIACVRGRVYKDINLAPALRLPSDAPALPPDPSRAASSIRLPEFINAWTFDVGIKTQDPLRLAGNLVNGAVSADIKLGGTGAQPLLTGAATVDRLLLKLPFSLIKVTQGKVTMNPSAPFDPALDVRAESRLSSYEVTIYAYGPLSDVKTRFTSTPPLSETDIATLLATGTTLSGDGAQLATEAVSRAAWLYLSEFYRKTFNKKKVIRDEPPKLHVGFAPSGVGADRSVDAVQASYDLTPKWRLSGLFSPGGRVNAALGYLIRFGKSRPPASQQPEP